MVELCYIRRLKEWTRLRLLTMFLSYYEVVEVTFENITPKISSPIGPILYYGRYVGVIVFVLGNWYENNRPQSAEPASSVDQGPYYRSADYALDNELIMSHYQL